MSTPVEELASLDFDELRDLLQGASNPMLTLTERTAIETEIARRQDDEGAPVRL